MTKFTKTATSIDGVYIIEPTVFGDERGYFMETYSKADFEEIGLNYDFIQDNQSRSKKGVLRGLHFQKENTQAKLVRCIRGAVFDVAVDLRPGSKTYGKWEGVVLTEENKKQFMIPRGFAHGFLVLSDVAEFAYKCDDVYNHKAEGGLRWNDETVAIKWPFEELGADFKMEDLLTSEKDGNWPTLEELKQTELFKEYAVAAAEQE
jgi:dTDP-4-dehydrorhamnose 3,5-epimerase